MAYDTRRVLVDAKAVIDLGVTRYHWMDDLVYERKLKEAAADLMDFIRDHRSRDCYGINIETEYEERCTLCWSIAESDDETGEPLCCRKAQERWQADEYCKLGLDAYKEA